MERKSWLITELERAKRIGMKVRVNGEECTYSNPEALSYVLEESSYMLDYISDENGLITGINFDMI